MALDGNKAQASSDNVDAIYTFYQADILEAINDIERGVEKLLRSPDLNPATIRTQINAIIRKSGYRDAVEAYLGAGYQSTINESFDLYKDIYSERFLFSEDSLAAFNIMKGQDLSTFSDLVDNVASQLAKQVTNGTTAGIAVDLTSEAVSSILTTFSNSSSTELETSVARLYRKANTSLALDNDINHFIYSGPTGGNIRPFCSRNVGKVKTSKQWNALNNGKGQPKPVMEFQGGYRCRHSLVGVPIDDPIVKENVSELSQDIQADAATARAT